MSDGADDKMLALLGLADLLPEKSASELKALAPGIVWALDTMVISFREEISNLDDSARDAFFRFTLDYGKHLDRFLKLAHESVSAEEHADRKGKMEKLRRLDLFAHLNTFDLSRIAGAFYSEPFPRGQVLMEEGKPGTAVYFLEEGSVGIFSGGNQVAVRGPGNLFGEMSCLTNTPATATLRAITDCQVLALTKQAFEEEVLSLPEIVPQFARMSTARLGDITHRLSEVLSHMPDALLKLDRQGIITGDVSQKCFEYLDTDELTGHLFSAILFKGHAEQEREWRTHYPNLWDRPEACNDHNYPLPRATTFIHSEKGARFYELTLFPTRENGVLSGFDVAVADITDQKRVEEERAQMERAMRNMVHKYLTLLIGDQIFGLDIDRALEIVHGTQFIRVPNVPPFIRGLFNLRGRILPAVDTGVLLGISRPEGQRESVVVVELKGTGEGKSQRFGMVVDHVSDILNIPESQIEPPESIAGVIRVKYIHGLAKTQQGVRLLLNLEGLMSKEQTDLVETVAQRAERNAVLPGAAKGR
ncbi:MAG: chemotaxis protein CheW [Deltaproteobacteria bacterium]|nr:chemotaxis protein CheW [Deltaproteobacteria bacterium]